MTASAARRGAAVLLGLALSALPAAPALALSDGEQPERGIGVVNALLIFGAIPIAISALIALLVVASRRGSGQRYRPGRPWDFDSVWFAGPADPDYAMVNTKPGSAVTGGGASAEW